MGDHVLFRLATIQQRQSCRLTDIDAVQFPHVNWNFDPQDRIVHDFKQRLSGGQHLPRLNVRRTHDAVQRGFDGQREKSSGFFVEFDVVDQLLAFLGGS